jgi:hypothetical protein
MDANTFARGSRIRSTDDNTFAGSSRIRSTDTNAIARGSRITEIFVAELGNIVVARLTEAFTWVRNTQGDQVLTLGSTAK